MTSLRGRVASISVLLAAAWLAGCTAGVRAGRTPAAVPASESPAARLAAARRLLLDEHYREAQTALQALIDSEAFAQLAQEDRYRALVDAAKLAYGFHRLPLAYRDITRAAALPPAVPGDVLSQIQVAFELQDPAGECAALTALATRWPEQLGKQPDELGLRILHDAQALPRARFVSLLEALYAAHWKLRWGVEPSWPWLRLTLALIESGALARASEVASHVTAPAALIAMRADRRFDAIVAAHPDWFDVDAAASREIERLAAQDNLKSLGLEVRLIHALILVQHYGAALAVADSAVGEIRSTNFPEKLYVDYHERYRALLHVRAWVLDLLGRWDEAVDQMSAASRMYENGALNVSDVIDLASLYCSRGQPSAAIAALERAGSASRYGSMQEASIRVDAFAQLNDAGEVDRSLSYLRAHQAEAPGTYVRSLVAANRLDRAASALLGHLRSKHSRLGALVSVQSYALPPLTPRDAELQRRWESIVARSAVQAEIARVGRVQRYAEAEDGAAEDW